MLDCTTKPLLTSRPIFTAPVAVFACHGHIAPTYSQCVKPDAHSRQAARSNPRAASFPPWAARVVATPIEPRGATLRTAPLVSSSPAAEDAAVQRCEPGPGDGLPRQANSPSAVTRVQIPSETTCNTPQPEENAMLNTASAIAALIPWELLGRIALAVLDEITR